MKKALAIMALLLAAIGFLGGLWRLGWGAPLNTPAMMNHGALVAAGFFGTLISLERAVASKHAWAYLAPAFAALGAVALLAGLPLPIPWVLLATAGTVLLLMYGSSLRTRIDAHVLIQAAGAVAWIGGAVWSALGATPGDSAWWWMAFLVLTIAGERIELSGLTGLDLNGRPLLWGALLGMMVSLAIIPVAGDGVRTFGASEMLLGIWLLRHDATARLKPSDDLLRFTVRTLRSGFVWLVLGGGALLFAGTEGQMLDAVLHAVFIGFVLSMVFGHAPLVIPQITGRAVQYSHRFYAHVALLHLSLIVRIAGDVGGWWELRRWGSLGNALVLVIFAVNMFSAVLAAKRSGVSTSNLHEESQLWNR